jgi:hypothetical protein
VFATFSLARLVLPNLPALAAAAASAVTPLFVVHARLFKGLNRHRHLDRRPSPHHAAGDQADRALAAGREFRARAFGARS